MTHYVQEILNRINNQFHFEIIESRRQQDDICKVLKKKDFNQEFSIWQNYSSKMKKKLRCSEVIRGISVLVEILIL